MVIRAIRKYSNVVLSKYILGLYVLHSLEFMCGSLICFGP